MKMITIDKDKFLRSFKIQNKQSFDLFLGSGASVSSGIPTGRELVLHFKREILISQGIIDFKKNSDLKIESIRNEIEKHFCDDKITNPYSHYFEEYLQYAEDRRDFLTDLVKNKKPSIGFLCLSSLVEQQKINTVWTTNFDDLIEKSISTLNYQSCTIISPENASSVDNFRLDIPRVVKLHGDFRYDTLQNTDDELQKLEENLHNYFIKSASKKGLLMIGYSGSDNSVMTSIDKILEKQNPFPKGLIWCIPKGIKPNYSLIELIEKANKQNGRSGFIEIDNFDFFMHELYKTSENHDETIDSIAKNSFEEKKPFKIIQPPSNIDPILLNTIKVKSFPKTLYSTKVSFQGVGQWKELRRILDNKNIVGAFHKQELLLFGSEVEIKNTFREFLIDEIKIKDVNESHFFYEDSYFLGLLYELIEKSLVNKYGFEVFKKSRNHGKYYLNNTQITNYSEEIISIYKSHRPNIPNDLLVYDAFEFKLEFVGKDLFFFILPTVHITNTNGSIPDRFNVQFLSNKILSNRYNDKFGKKINFWLNKLKTENEKLNFALFDFNIVLSDYFSTAAKQGKANIHWFPTYYKCIEPNIYFHHSDETKKLIKPLEGLKYFGPLEESYGNSDSKIKLAILSPEFGFENVKNHLLNLLNPIYPKSEKEYLIKYPGFDEVYKKQLIIPTSSDSGLVSLIKNKETQFLNPISFYELIKRKIDLLAEKSTEINCVVIYIPDAWKKFRELKNKQTYFDLHDSLKLYSVKKGLKLQFIEDKSIKYYDQAKIRWWLSLGIYVKSNGTPWKIKPSNNETAFVGLSYATRNSENNKVVMGSSQIFDGNGNGLKFLMQPIEKPVFFGKNPFMSKDDAFRLVSNIRNTYYKIDPVIGLKKLVIHKTTQFTRDEIEGISQALQGVDNVELVQIQQFTNWRAINVNFNTQKKKYEINGFPIERGSIIQLDDFSFLLWTHGLVEHREFQKKYYQGKRSIPSPLLIKRFKGTEPIEVIAEDILKLTKMNWNGAELYKTLPVTIDFSKRLSVMGKQIEDLGNKAYDFRYFI
jgi:NAD-dependent SIR2 family protein deacetylase